MASLFQKEQEEYVRKSEIKECSCGHLYIQTRVAQKKCLWCIDKKDIHKHPLYFKINRARIK